MTPALRAAILRAAELLDHWPRPEEYAERDRLITTLRRAAEEPSPFIESLIRQHPDTSKGENQ